MATEGDGPVAISISTGEGLDRTLKIEKLVDITDKHPELYTEKQLADGENEQVEYTMEVASKNNSFEVSEGEIFLDPLSEISQVEQPKQAGMELPKNEVLPHNGGEVGGHVQTVTEETEVIEERKEKFAEDIENHDIVIGAGHTINGDAKLDVEEVEESEIEETLDEHVQTISNQQDSIKEDVHCLEKEAEISEADIKGAEKEEGNAESYRKEASDLLQETTFQEYEAPVSTHDATDISFKKDVELETNVTPTDEVDLLHPMQIYEQTEELQAFPGVTREDARTESASENAEVISCTEETRAIQNTPEFLEKEEATPVDCPKENDTITEEVSEATSIAQETVEYAPPEIQTAENQTQEFIEEKSRDYEASAEAACLSADTVEKSSDEQAIQETPSSLVEEETTQQITREEDVQATSIKEEDKEAYEKCEEPTEVADATEEIGNEAIKQTTEANKDIHVPIPEEEAYVEESTKEIAEDSSFLSEVSEVTTKEVTEEDHSTVSSYGLVAGEGNQESELKEAAAENKEHVNYTPEQQGPETTLTDEAVLETKDHAQKEESYNSETIEKDIQTAEDEGNADADIAPAECLATIAPDQPSLHIEDIELQKEEIVNSTDKFEEETPAAPNEGEKGFVESKPENDEQIIDTDIASEETESKDINVQEQKKLNSEDILEKQIPAVEDEGEACMKKDEEKMEQETLPTTVTRELPLDAHADECSTTKVEELIPEAADEADTCTKEAAEEIEEHATSPDTSPQEKNTILTDERALNNEEVELQLEENVGSKDGMEEQISTTADEGEIDLKEAEEENKESVSVIDFPSDVKAKDIEPESCSADPQEENKDEVTYTDITTEDKSLQEQVLVVADEGDTILNEAEEENKENIDNSPEIELQSEENVSSTDNLEKHIPALADDAERCSTEAESEYKEQATITDITSEVESVPTILTDQTVLESEEVELPAEENVVSADYMEKEMSIADEGEGEGEATSIIAEAESEEQVSVTDTTQDKGIATTLTREISLETEEADVLPKIADKSNENLGEISAASELGDTCLKKVDENENKEQVEEKSPATILTEETNQDIQYTDAREDSNSEEILEKQIPAAVYEAETDLKEVEKEKQMHVEPAEIAAEGKGLPTILVDETTECIEVTDVQAEEIDSKEVLEEKIPIALDEGEIDLKEAEADIKEQVETTDIVPEQKGVETILSDETHERALALEEVEADSNEGELEYKEEIKCTEVSAEDTDVTTIVGEEAVMEIQSVEAKEEEKPEEACKGEERTGVLDDHIREYIPEDATEQIKDDDCNAVKSENEILEDSQTIVDKICETKDIEKSEEGLPVKHDGGQQEECSSPAPIEALKEENITEDTSAEVVPSNDVEDSLEVPEVVITNLPDVKPEETTQGPSNDNVGEVICTKEETQESLSISTQEVEATITEALPEIQNVDENIIEKSEVLPVKHDGDQQEECCSPTPTEALKDESINEYTSAEVVASNAAEDSLEVLRDYGSEAVTTNLPDVESVEATPGPSSDNVEEVICTKEETQESSSTSTREVETTTTEALPEIQTVEEEEEKIEGHAEGTDSIVEAKAETVEHETIPEEENINSFSSENEIGKEIQEYSSTVRSLDTDVKGDEVSLTESTTEDKEQVDNTHIAPEEKHNEGIDICKTEPGVETLVEEGTTISEVQDETDNSEDATETNNKICEEVQDEPVIIDRGFNDEKIIDETLKKLNTVHVEEHKIAEDYQGEEEEIEQLNEEGSSAENVNEGNENDISAECVSDVTDEKVKECIEEAVESKEEITEDNAETLTRELISEDTIKNSQDIVQETIEIKEENASGLLTENKEDALKSEEEILEDPVTEEIVSTLPVVQLLLQKHEPEKEELPKSRDVLPEEMKPEPSNENAEAVTCKENDAKESASLTEEACIVGEIEEKTTYEVSSSRSAEPTEESAKEEEKIEAREDCKEAIDAKEVDDTDVKNTEELIGEAIVEATSQAQTHEEVAEWASIVEDETEKSYDHTEQNDEISEEVPDELKIADRDVYEEQTTEENVTICAKGSVEEEDVEDHQADEKTRSSNEEESSIETPGEGHADEVSTEYVPEVTVEECTKEAAESKDEVLEESQKVDDHNGAELLLEADTEVTSVVLEPSEVIEKVEAEVYDVEDKVSIAETTEEVTSKEVEVSHVSLEKINPDAPEEETVERCEVVPESDTKGIDEVSEVELTADQAFSNKVIPKEPSALLPEEKELIASENEQTKEVEIPAEEDIRDILDTKSEEVICLPEEPRDLEVSTFTTEKLDAGETEEESKETSETVTVSDSQSTGVVCEDETVTDQTQCEVEEKLEDYVSVKETLNADAPEEETKNGASIVPEVDSESHYELVKEETNALPTEENELEASEYDHVPESVVETIEEEKPKEVEMPADEDKQESSITMPTEPCLLTEDPSNTEPTLHTPDACETEEEVEGISETVPESDYPSITVASEDEIVADQTVCEEITETPLSQERELAASELALEELDTVEEIKEAPEVVPILDSELIEVVSSEGIIKEEIQSPSSTLLPEEKEHETSEPEHETTPQEKSKEQDYIEEVEVSANEETQTLLDTSPVEKECLQKEEPSEQLEESNETSETVSTFPSIIAETKEEITVDETISKEVTDLPLEVPSYVSLDEEKESKASECDQQKLDADTPEEVKGNEEIPLSVSHISCEASKDEIVADQLEEASSALVSDQKELKASEQEHETTINENLEEVTESTDEASEYVFVARSVEDTCPQKEEPSELQVPEANETDGVKETFEEVAEYDSQSIKEVSKDDTIVDQTVSDVITEMPIPDKIEEVKADEAELAPEKLDTEAIKDVKEDSEVISKSDLPSIDVTVSDEIITDQALPETTLLPEEKELKQTDEYEHASATLDKNLEKEYAKETEVFADEDTKDVIESSSEETMHLQEEESRELKVSELSPECEEKLTATFESTYEASKEDAVAEELLHQYDEQLLVSPTLVPTEKEEATMHKDEVETEEETKESFEPMPEVSPQSGLELARDEIVDQIPSSALIYEEKRCNDTSIISNAGEESVNVVETPTVESRTYPHSAEETSIPDEDPIKLIVSQVEFPSSPYTERDSSNEGKNLEAATPDSRAVDSYQTPTETNPTANIEVLNKEIIDEKEIAEVSDISSVGEENVRESQQENESREEKYPEEKSDTVTEPTEYHHEVSEVNETGSLSRDIKIFKDYSPNEKEELTCESSTAQVIYAVEKESSFEVSQGVLMINDETTQDKKQLEKESCAAEIPSSKDEVLECAHGPEFEDNKPSDETFVASESKEDKFSESGKAEVDSIFAQISLSEKLMEEQTNERGLHDHEDEEDEDEVDEAKRDEDTEHKQASHGYDEPVIVEASRDSEVMVSPKKSHNILSGMGKSVKHSISKVKKAIIGKSSNSKTQPDK